MHSIILRFISGAYVSSSFFLLPSTVFFSGYIHCFYPFVFGAFGLFTVLDCCKECCSEHFHYNYFCRKMFYFSSVTVQSAMPNTG